MSKILLFVLFCAIPILYSQRLGQHGIIYPTEEEVYDNTKPLTVHLVPHTHDDLGWLKSVDSYFYGTEAKIIKAGVQYILDSVIMELSRDPSRQFIYVESGYFKRWWDEQDENTKELTKKLVKDRQLIFIHGGYVMNDEAVVYYEDSIDQMALGHKFLLDTFGVVPEIAWHIDPFGHASAQASLYAQMGFNAFYITRIDFQEKEHRVKNADLEFIWQPECSLGDEGAIFTHVTYYHYGYPEGFCFDILCPQDPIVDNKENCLYNVDKKADMFAKWFRKMSYSYRSEHLMHTAGDDFAYQAAAMNFKSMDKLLKYINNNPTLFNMKISYSNPEDYIKTINSQNIMYSTYQKDFFPYADFPNAFWTGYYTSKPGMKAIVRRMGEFMQATKNLLTSSVLEGESNYIKNNWQSADKSLYKLEEAMALSQHHDAVTGTERNSVVASYANYLIDGKEAVMKTIINPLLQEKTKEKFGFEFLEFVQCSTNATLSNQDEVCTQAFQDQKPVLISIFNPGSLESSMIRIRVPEPYLVKDSQGNQVDADNICIRNKNSDCTLFFKAYLVPYEISFYYLIPSEDAEPVLAEKLDSTSTYKINEEETITIQEDLQKFSIAHGDVYKTDFMLNYVYYESYEATNNIFRQFGHDQNSGAYIFRPSQETLNTPKLYTIPEVCTVFSGINLIQIQLQSQEVITNIRIFNDLKAGIEVESFINSINIDDFIGKEVALQIKVPSILNDKTFYTDSMGLDMLKRILRENSEERPLSQPVAGNYYPINSAIYIEDGAFHERLTVIPDRAQGGSSLRTGQIEIMLHRRVLADDARGVAEPLDEHDADGKGLRQLLRHKLLFSSPVFETMSHREVQYERDLAPQVFLSSVLEANFVEGKPREEGKANDLRMFKVISRPVDLNTFVVRVQNLVEENTRSINLKNIFGEYKNAIELSLSANQDKKSAIKKRLNWNGIQMNDPSLAKEDYLEDGTVNLRPLEIRTFKISI